MTSKAMLLADIGDGGGAVELAEAALSAPALAPKARVMAMQQAAHGYAIAGDRASVDWLLDEMAEQLASIEGDEHPWGGDRLRRRSPDDIVNLHRATCYGHIGLAPQAAETWDIVSQNAPPEDRRDRGVHLARYAAALLDAGRPEDATRRAIEGAQYLRPTGSARMRREFQRLHDKTASWTHTSAGRDLHDALDALARPSIPGS